MIEKEARDTKTLMSSTDLAFERTMLAHERTLMAWVRTATAMISFGFTLYKFFQEAGKASNAGETILTPRVVAMIMILFGLLGLFFAQIQHHSAMKKLKQNYPGVQKSVSSVLAVLVLLFGLVLFLGALFRQ